jgi:hypothetical protein
MLFFRRKLSSDVDHDPCIISCLEPNKVSSRIDNDNTCFSSALSILCFTEILIIPTESWRVKEGPETLP